MSETSHMQEGQAVVAGPLPACSKAATHTPCAQLAPNKAPDHQHPPGQQLQHHSAGVRQ